MKNIHYIIDKYGSVTPQICDDVVENESNITLLTASFPEELSEYTKIVIFKTNKYVLLEDGTKTKNPSLIITDEGIELNSSLINAQITEISFKALSRDYSICFTSKISNFPAVFSTLNVDTGIPCPLPAGLIFEGEDNISISDSIDGSIRKVRVAMTMPLEQKFNMTDIQGLQSALNSKFDKSQAANLTDNNYTNSDKAAVEKMAELEIEDYAQNPSHKASKYANTSNYAQNAYSSERSDVAEGYEDENGNVKNICEEINSKMPLMSVHNIDSRNVYMRFEKNATFTAPNSIPLNSLTVDAYNALPGDIMEIDFTCLNLNEIDINAKSGIKVIFKGLDCDNGVFIPLQDSRYNITLYHDGERIIAYVA